MGQVGKVAKLCVSGDVKASVNGHRWIFNAECLVPAPDAHLPNNPG